MFKYDVFVSYSKQYSVFAKSLIEALEAEGVKVWYDNDALRFGDTFLRSIEDALEQSRYFVLIISPDYLNNQWCTFEAGVALGRDAASNGGHIFLLDLDNAQKNWKSWLPAGSRKYETFDPKDVPVEQIASKIAEAVKQEGSAGIEGRS